MSPGRGHDDPSALLVKKSCEKNKIAGPPVFNPFSRIPSHERLKNLGDACFSTIINGLFINRRIALFHFFHLSLLGCVVEKEKLIYIPLQE